MSEENLRPVRYLKTRDALKILGRGRSWLYDIMASDPTFPKPHRLTEKRLSFSEAEIIAWAESRRDQSASR